MPNLDPVLRPPSPPPRLSPINHHCVGFKNGTPEFLRQVLYSYIYVQLISGQSFWMYPTQLEERHLTGFLWNSQRWISTRFAWENIECFI